jgi:hypothetical protein
VIKESTVPREIQLKEKWIYVPTPIVAKPFFLVSATVTPIVQSNVVVEHVVDSLVTMGATPIVGSSMTEIDEEEEPIANHEEEQ